MHTRNPRGFANSTQQPGGQAAARAGAPKVPPPSENNARSVKWSTPDWLFEKLHEEFCFQMDACASAQNAKCEAYIDEEQDCLATEWNIGAVSRFANSAAWMNPPWGRRIGRFIQRAHEQSKRHRMIVVCLLPASTDTRWWRDWVWSASEVRLITGRLHFTRDDGYTGPSLQPAAIVTFTPWSSGPPQVSLMCRGADR